jgi:hypothetical protein
MRFDPAPLLITKPKQIAAHLPAPKSPVAGNQQSILTSTLLLGSRPSLTISCRDGPRAEVAALLIYSWREAEETCLLFFDFGEFGV